MLQSWKIFIKDVVDSLYLIHLQFYGYLYLDTERKLYCLFYNNYLLKYLWHLLQNHPINVHL